ncbi:MAG: 6-phosphofructokinase [Clostridiales bacterium]|jgi:6-phosphofructokinase 1|nr:6-phosphofructokinase [Clostridiales bacterium]
MKNVIVGQSGGPTAVINCSLAGVYATALEHGDKMGKVLGMRNGIQGLMERRYVDMGEYIRDDFDVEILKRTPSSFLGSCRYKLPDPKQNEAVFEKVFGILNELEVGYFFYIGGNDSMDTINKLHTYGEKIGSPIRFLGVPKTVDNDLAVTDHSPGFGSAAKYVATSTKELILDARVYNNGAVTIVEAMGRNTGWLAASAALAKGPDSIGPDLVFLPEIAFDLDGFLDKVSILAQQKGHSPVIVVSEGIQLADGRYVSELGREDVPSDAFGHIQLMGTASYLAQQVRNKLGAKVRAVEFATLQRSAAHLQSQVDAIGAFAVGQHAVNAAAEGETNKVIIFKRLSSRPYAFETCSMELAKMANIEKHVPLEWITPTKDHVTQDYIDYALPLIQGEVAPYFVNGMPRHIRLP